MVIYKTQKRKSLIINMYKWDEYRLEDGIITRYSCTLDGIGNDIECFSEYEEESWEYGKGRIPCIMRTYFED